LIRGERGRWERKGEGFSDEDSFFAAGAGFQTTASELIEEVLPGWEADFFFGLLFLLRFLQLEKDSGFFEFGFGVAGSQEAVMPDFEIAILQVLIRSANLIWNLRESQEKEKRKRNSHVPGGKRKNKNPNLD
jgi:hypothetical protein